MGDALNLSFNPEREWRNNLSFAFFNIPALQLQRLFPPVVFLLHPPFTRQLLLRRSPRFPGRVGANKFQTAAVLQGGYDSKRGRTV